MRYKDKNGFVDAFQCLRFNIKDICECLVDSNAKINDEGNEITYTSVDGNEVVLRIGNWLVNINGEYYVYDDMIFRELFSPACNVLDFNYSKRFPEDALLKNKMRELASLIREKRPNYMQLQIDICIVMDAVEEVIAEQRGKRK